MMERNSANDEVGKNDLEKHGDNTMLSEKTVKIIRYLQTRGKKDSQTIELLDQYLVHNERI